MICANRVETNGNSYDCVSAKKYEAKIHGFFGIVFTRLSHKSISIFFSFLSVSKTQNESNIGIISRRKTFHRVISYSTYMITRNSNKW